MADDDESNTEQQRRRCPSTDGMVELDHLRLDNGAASSEEAKHAKNAPLSPLADDDDSDSDTDDEEGISSSYHSSSLPPPPSSSHSHHPPIPPRDDGRQRTYLLGRTIAPPSHSHALLMRKFQKSLYWFTYRNDLVVPLRPYAGATPQSLVGNLTHGGGIQDAVNSVMTGEANGGGGMRSDAGWGCMLRSAQMLLAEAVRRHYAPERVVVEGGGVGCSDKKRSKNSRGSSYGQAKSVIRHRTQHHHQAPSKSNIEHHYQNWRQLEDPREVERIANWFADFPNHVDPSEEKSGSADRRRSNNNNDTSSSIEEEDDELEQEIEEYGNGGLNNHWYSLHQMVAAGLGLGILPGEWYGPTTACHVLRELNEIHVERRESLAGRIKETREAVRIKKAILEDSVDGTKDEKETDDNGNDGLTKCDMFKVHIATEGCVYLDAISKLMTSGDEHNGDGGDSSDNGWDEVNNGDGIDDPLSPFARNDVIDDPLRPPPQQPPQNDSNDKQAQWDTSLLLLLPLRLGIQSIPTERYGSTLAKLVALTQSVGMLGGTPRHALWFYGADAVDPPPAKHAADGTNGVDADNGGDGNVVGGWYGLDPHTVQLAPRGTRILVDAEKPTTTYDNIDEPSSSSSSSPDYKWQVQLTDTYLRSLHISSTHTHFNHDASIPLSKLDPSCALGFYLRNSADFDAFRRSIEELTMGHCKTYGLPEIVTILEKTPNYEVDVSSAIRGMTAGVGGGGGGGGDGVDDIDGFSMHSDGENSEEEEDDDDDDFVLI
eukprot:CAMPEP_0183710892 /NCGR_PEP_ID=MMETSP0737-20130205/6511_1 /TAXON_ID=385413 /ORGANISM="Thalassiosira miniscula, Strain CCMP1093" /LENGTH=768 /DNA_ID=CAMNT_0025939259 /DNA_START=128 /DNA_END=2434 /DNA_ORIENTATION=+